MKIQKFLIDINENICYLKYLECIEGIDSTRGSIEKKYATNHEDNTFPKNIADTGITENRLLKEEEGDNTKKKNYDIIKDDTILMHSVILTKSYSEE